MRSRDDLWSIEAVGKGLYKLTIYGKDPVSKDNQGAAEILLDDDDIAELVFRAHKAQQAKVMIT
jgi:predicted acetyltransferase